MPRLQTSGLSYQYENSDVFHFEDIRAEGLEPLLIIGGSGVGKSTLLHLLAGLMEPKSGSVIIGDTNLQTLSSGLLDKFRGEHIGIVFQDNHFIEALNVLENLSIAQKLAGLPVNEDQCLHFLECLNMGSKAYKQVNELSQGERQRVAIARALVNKPSIILADEPTSALDDQNCEEVIRLLETQAKENQAKLIIVTHDSRLKSRFKDHIEL